jgi:formate hydrogenlyase transcriptional activator
MDRLEKNNQLLESQAMQLRSLAEITDPNSVSMAPDLVVKLGLQKACEVVSASRGWILMLDESRRHHFTVVCGFDSSESSQLRMGFIIPFAATQVKQAVIKRKPIFLAEPIWGESSKEVAKDTSGDREVALAIPLTTGSDVFGVMYLEDKNEDFPFSPADLDFLQPLAACLSYRYENLQLRNQTAIQTDQFNCISAFNETCNKGLVQGKVFQLMARELQTYMPMKVSFLALSDTSQEYLQLLEVASEEPISLRSGMTLPIRQSLFRLVLEENREIHQKDVTSVFNPLEARWFRELGINSCYLAPFRLQGINVGLLFVGSDTKEGFSNPQQVILQQAVQYLGLAVHNQMLLQKIDEQSRELEALNRIGNVVTSSFFDLNKILDEVGLLIDRVITVEAGAIYLREEDGLAIKKSFGTQASRIEPFKVKNIEGICGYVMSRGESVLVRDASQNPHVSSMVKYFEGVKARSILCVPMVIDGDVIGAIHMWNKRGGPFNAHDNKVMKSVASSLATGIASSRLHQMCQQSTTGEASACGKL